MKLPTRRLVLALARYAAATYAWLIGYGAQPWAYVLNGAVMMGIYYSFLALAPGARK